jgi:glycosyltransferase involved in cell wall biosynthesis
VVINTIHGFYFHDHMRPLARRFYIAMEQIAARCSDRILSQNAEDRVTAIREHIAPDGLIRVLGNGIDLTQFDRPQLDPDALTRLRASLSIPTDTPIVGFVGRLVAEKGILELFEAAQRIIATMPRVHFMFVGIHEPDKIDGISPATAERYSIAAHCTFTGRRSDMPELYALMDMLVLPSHREGFPRAPMEAAAMGLPCIVTDIRGCREVVVAGETGLFVPLGDAPALAEAILHLLRNPSLAASMGAKGRVLAQQRFDERLVFERVRQTYAELLQVKGLTNGN